MTQYWFRFVDDKSRLQCAKFEDGESRPMDVYTITYNPHHQVCDCPAYTAKCKHLKMVQRYLELVAEYGENALGVYYDDKAADWIFSAIGVEELADFVAGKQELSD